MIACFVIVIITIVIVWIWSLLWLGFRVGLIAHALHGFGFGLDFISADTLEAISQFNRKAMTIASFHFEEYDRGGDCLHIIDLRKAQAPRLRPQRVHCLRCPSV